MKDSAPAAPRPALDARVAELYLELRRIAAAALSGQHGSHTLQPTALVHETWLRLTAARRLDTGNRREFLSLAAKAMRHILIDHARGKQRLKRGGGQLMLTWDPLSMPALAADPVDFVILDRALDRLSALDPRQVEIVELRFLAGLSVDEVAELLGISTATVKRDAAMARAWILREIGG